MSELPEDLNYDCNYNMFLAKQNLQNLPNVKDRQKAVKWMRKLATCTDSIAEMRLRNEFMYYLVVNIQNSELKPPFTALPPDGPLTAIKNLLPCESAAEQVAYPTDSKQRPFIYQNSPDGGAFLAAQPMPRCGAFCYLAVVCQAKD